ATFGIACRYAMWLRRPPTRMYWRRGWAIFLRPSLLGHNVVGIARRLFPPFCPTAFIWSRRRSRAAAHLLLMWGCLIGVAITFPLVFGWVHFTTPPGNPDLYEAHVFGFKAGEFGVDSVVGFVTFHALVWSSFLVIGGVMIAFRRRMVDH